MRLKISQARFRLVLPIVYVLIGGVLLVLCFLHLGHSRWCQYFLNSMFPAEMMAQLLKNLFFRLEIVARDSPTWIILDNALTVPIPFVITVIQYYVIGVLIDKFLQR